MIFINPYNDPERVYCIRCNRRQPYHTEVHTKENEKRGIKFEYLVTDATCSVCNAPVYVPTINDRNCANANEAFFKAKAQMERMIEE